MGLRPAAIGLCAVLALAQPAPLRAQEIAQVLGVAIDRSELAAAADGPAADLGRLYDRVWQAVSGHYVRQNGLEATPEEIAEVIGYEREFERRDRDQRARKLEELGQRLAGEGVEPAERARLEDFRATLLRLAQADEQSDRAPPNPQLEAAQRVQWIEMWKMNGALYRHYGGIVALTRFGPFPHGARLALLEDYERRGLLRFSDRQLRGRLLELLAARPPVVLAPEQVDFTPYWKRPIPPSYFPD